MSSHPTLPLAGQRWISNTETSLGLGTVLKVEGRCMTLYFSACGELRTYAIADAPLTRLRFAAGDLIADQHQRSIRVTEAEERGGKLIYRGLCADGSTTEIPEEELSDHLRIANPRQRMLTGLIDPNPWFELRHLTRQLQAQVDRSPIRGLAGGRIDLLHHQLYIAHEVSRRQSPRVLLADEVGLGKTIEAGLILHRLHYTERVTRVLILTPDSLIHQWLVELLRRFNLHFSLYDEERCRAITESGQGENPFHAEQLVLAPMALFRESETRGAQALAGNWDLLIVDEAHHLEWSPTAASSTYRLVEGLARSTPAVLLLTATPEQLGKAGHFARLRLLDPERFHSLDPFLEEEGQYREVAEAIEQLLGDAPLSPESAQQLIRRMGHHGVVQELEVISSDSATPEQQRRARGHLVRQLLDRHGTGRVLFRNTRARLEGFPERLPIPYPLTQPETYRTEWEAGDLPPEAALTPEVGYRDRHTLSWLEFDPRPPLVIELLARIEGEKVLLICASAETAIELSQTLKRRHAIPTALFHEGMSILERDRNAAWFADPEEGARLLICSEIGSEGRNFQFAHHLFLFDLPFNPDLLEQRIGRLDRIGQQQAVRIHIPYFEGSPQEVMFRWYHEGLDAFRHPGASRGSVHQQLEPMLLQCMEEGEAQEITLLLESTRALRRACEETLKRGRDPLLELNSCRAEIAAPLAEQIREEERFERTSLHGLPNYLERLFATFGVESEEHSPGSWIFRPGSHMAISHLPGLPEEGITCTFDRDIALKHEERQFLTWEHPLVQAAMAQVLDEERGTTAAVTIVHPAIRPGRLLLELIFCLECIAPGRLQVGRYLPPTLIRQVVDQEQGDRTALFADGAYTAQEMEPRSALRIIQALESRLQRLFETGETRAEAAVPAMINEAVAAMALEYDEEIERLDALRRVNPAVRRSEVVALAEEKSVLEGYLQDARLKLDSARLLISG